VKTQFGWHIIMMEEKQPSSVVPLEDVAGEIKNMITQKKQQDAFFQKLEELREEYPVEIVKETPETPEVSDAEKANDEKAEGGEEQKADEKVSE
jgi:hypothetical protein